MEDYQQFVRYRRVVEGLKPTLNTITRTRCLNQVIVIYYIVTRFGNVIRENKIHNVRILIEDTIYHYFMFTRDFESKISPKKYVIP